MTAWQSGEVEVNGVRLHYTRTGGPKPPLVLAHGVTDDGLCWTPLAEALAPDYDVVMVDARGHGHSSAPLSGYGPMSQARDHHDLIQALGLKQAILLGHSMGAVTVLVLAGLYPDVPRAALLEDPPGWWAPPDMPLDEMHQRVAGMKAWASQLKTKTRATLIAEEHANNPRWSEAELGPWADSKLRFSPHVADCIFTLEPEEHVEWAKILPAITCPLLAITADTALGAALTPAGVAALKTHVPHLQQAHVPEAGHNIRRDQLERYLNVVRAFLTGLPRE
jgi:pimeloyl-ACP methyl ester carboxylesterase